MTTSGEWELSAVLSFMCRLLVSTNRSLGSQPGLNPAAFFCPRPLGFGRRGARAKNAVLACMSGVFEMNEKNLFGDTQSSGQVPVHRRYLMD